LVSWWFIRGEANEDSDIDFLINVRENHSRWFPGGLLADLEDLLGYKVDIVIEKSLHELIRERILKEAIPL
jgi:predicted nucleotidyltransferase